MYFFVYDRCTHSSFVIYWLIFDGLKNVNEMLKLQIEEMIATDAMQFILKLYYKKTVKTQL